MVARRQLWRYLAGREDGESPLAPLFMGKFGRPINDQQVYVANPDMEKYPGNTYAPHVCEAITKIIVAYLNSLDGLLV